VTSACIKNLESGPRGQGYLQNRVHSVSHHRAIAPVRDPFRSDQIAHHSLFMTMALIGFLVRRVFSLDLQRLQLAVQAERSMPMNSAVREMLPPKRLSWAIKYSRSKTSLASARKAHQFFAAGAIWRRRHERAISDGTYRQ